MGLRLVAPLVVLLSVMSGTLPANAAEPEYPEASTEPPAKARAVCDAVLRVPPRAAEAEIVPLAVTSPPDDAAFPPEQPDAGTSGVPEVVPPPPPPRFLASVGVPLQHTPYDQRWQAVQQSGLSYECASFVLDRTIPLGSFEDLADFNRQINGRVRYAEDSGSDAWAEAADTLWSGQGDCEDIAILKLQLLIAVGVPEDDIYFTLVRDGLRRRDHAVAVVRLGGRSWVLDSLDDALRDADQAVPAYQAVMAFSGERKWLLGTERHALLRLR